MPRPGIDREQLMSAITSVFAARGFEGATMAELSRATGLRKASLYHHFPGGKLEMLGAVIRATVALLESDVFGQLQSHRSPGNRLLRMLDGFDTYCESGQRSCVLAVIAHSTAADEFKDGISSQFQSWTHQLEQTLHEIGYGDKRSARVAREILATLYGSLTTSRLLDDPAVYTQAVKRLRKQVAVA